MPTRAVIPIHGPDHCPDGPDPIPCLGLPFCSAITGAVEVDDNASDFHIVDLESATFRTNSALLTLVEDTGNTPEWGIAVPADRLAQVYTWVERSGVAPDGSHYVSWVIDGDYSVTNYGPNHFNVATPSSIANPLADDQTGPDGIYQVAHLGDTADWVVGVIHSWKTGTYTNGPKNFRYGISVCLLGSLPT